MAASADVVSVTAEPSLVTGTAPTPMSEGLGRGDDSIESKPGSTKVDGKALLAEFKLTLELCRNLVRPGSPEWERQHAIALKAAGVESFRSCKDTGDPWQANVIVQSIVGRDVICVETCGGGKGTVMLTTAKVVGGLTIFVIGLSALESEMMERAKSMRIDIVRVRGTSAVKPSDVDAAAAGDASVYARMRQHHRTDPALIVVVQVMSCDVLHNSSLSALMYMLTVCQSSGSCGYCFV